MNIISKVYNNYTEMLKDLTEARQMGYAASFKATQGGWLLNIMYANENQIKSP